MHRISVRMHNYICHSVLILSVYIFAFYAHSSLCMPHMGGPCLCSEECIVYIRCKQLLCWLSVRIRCSYNYNQIEHALLAMCVIGSLPYQTAQYIVLSM